MAYQWPKSGAYKLINKDSVSALKRLRKNNYFIVDTRDFPNMDCDLCKKPIPQPEVKVDVNGFEYRPSFDNRATYFPTTKILQVLHYYCSWQHLFGQIYSMDGTAHIKVDHLEFIYINGQAVGLA
jgi:hypothetical protein